MRPPQVPLGITVSPLRVLVALLLVAAAVATLAWAVVRSRSRDGASIDEPLQRLRGFHIFGPDDDDDDDRRVHVPLIGRRSTGDAPRPLAAPPPPSAPAPPATRVVLPPAPPSARSNGHGSSTPPARPATPRGEAPRPDIDDQLGRDILLVEDDESIATMYLMLLGARGYTTRHAHDGVEGIAMVRKERPALILLDMMMPRMDGLQFLEALRGWPKTSAIPVVVLSNVADHSLVERALALGAVEYLIKAQTRPQVLVGALPHWLRGNRALTL
ncbi:MAG TPA: response regulator [Candidatus Angelobacter sp.]|nr:response regulator [Candidatus Angelobacter sp.]